MAVAIVYNYITNDNNQGVGNSLTSQYQYPLSVKEFRIISSEIVADNDFKSLVIINVFPLKEIQDE